MEKINLVSKEKVEKNQINIFNKLRADYFLRIVFE